MLLKEPIERNSHHKCIVRFREAPPVTSLTYTVNKDHKKHLSDANKYSTYPEYKVANRQKHKKHWSHKVDEQVFGISQEDMFKKFFLDDAIVNSQTCVKIANTLIVCLGAKGNGKSYTVFGSDKSNVNRGLAGRIITSLCQLNTHSSTVTIHARAIEHYKRKIYDLLETPKVTKSHCTAFKKELVQSEEYFNDLIRRITRTRAANEADKTNPIHHMSDVVLHLSVDLSCDNLTYIADIYLLDMEAFDNVQADNLHSLDAINRKFLKIENFSKYQIKIIGTLKSENVHTIESLMCILRLMRNYIDEHTHGKSSVYLRKDNIDYLEEGLKNKMYEMIGILKLAEDRVVKVRNPNVIRDTVNFLKRLTLAYVNDKVEEAIIIKMSGYLSDQMIFQVCRSLYVSAKLNLEHEKNEMVKVLEYEHMINKYNEHKMKNIVEAASSKEELDEDDSEEEGEEEEEPDEARREDNVEKKRVKHNIELIKTIMQFDPITIEPFKIVWAKFLDKSPILKFTLEHYRNQMNTLQNTLNKTEIKLQKDKSIRIFKETEDLMTEVGSLIIQIILTRKNYLETQERSLLDFEAFSKINKVLALRNDTDLLDSPISLSVHTSDERCVKLKSTDMYAFDTYIYEVQENMRTCTE